tara:strand:+ start:413 stop:625 length:213 start_codon:yes stop_codon:yes gene_type:complete
MESTDIKIIEDLTLKVLNDLEKSNREVERKCWAIVHEYRHGVKPSEYDIREIDETLYLAVLSKVKNELEK